jgi:hypothetical protein
MKFVKIRQFDRPPSFQDAFAAMRQERAGYAQRQPSVEAAYEEAQRQLEAERAEKLCDGPGKNVQ